MVVSQVSTPSHHPLMGSSMKSSSYCQLLGYPPIYDMDMEWSIHPWLTHDSQFYSPLYINHISTIVNPWLTDNRYINPPFWGTTDPPRTITGAFTGSRHSNGNFSERIWRCDSAQAPGRGRERWDLFFYGGYSNSWVVYNGKSEHKKDDDWGNPGLNRTNMDDLCGPKSWRYPNSWMDGWFHGKSEHRMDDDWGMLGVPPPILGKLHI